MTPRPVDTGGLSAFTAPQASMPGKYQIIDVSKLSLLRAVCDNRETGHYSIVPQNLARMQEWISSRALVGEPHPFTLELMMAVIGTA